MKNLFLIATILISISSPVMAANIGKTVNVDVNGLVCDFCARALEKVFSKQEEVNNIEVDLDTKIITIHFNEGQNLDNEKIEYLITDSGYNVVEIHRDEK